MKKTILLLLLLLSAGLACAQAEQHRPSISMEVFVSRRPAPEGPDQVLVIYTMLTNRGDPTVILPTTKIGPTTMGPSPRIYDGELRIFYKHIPKKLKDETPMIYPLVSFSAVELRQNESTVIEYRFPILAGKVVTVVVSYEIGEEVASRYGFDACSLTAKGVEGVPFYYGVPLFDR